MSKKATVCSSTGGGAAKFSAFPAPMRRNARVTRTGDAAKRDLDTRSAALVSLAALHGYFAIADRGLLEADIPPLTFPELSAGS